MVLVFNIFHFVSRHAYLRRLPYSHFAIIIIIIIFGDAGQGYIARSPSNDVELYFSLVLHAVRCSGALYVVQPDDDIRDRVKTYSAYSNRPPRHVTILRKPDYNVPVTTFF